MLRASPTKRDRKTMTESKSLVAVEQREVEFYEDTIVAVRLPDQSIFIPGCRR